MTDSKRLLLLSTMVALFAVTAGCLPNADRVDQIIDAGRSNVVTTIPIAHEFRTVFTNSQASIASSVQNRPRLRHVQLKGDIFDRYLIYLNLEVEFVSWRRLDVVSYNVKGFYLSEITSIATEDGRPVYYHGDSFRFGEAQWRTLMTNGFRFDLIGITLKTNQPVERFRQERDAELRL